MPRNWHWAAQAFCGSTWPADYRSARRPRLSLRRRARTIWAGVPMPPAEWVSLRRVELPQAAGSMSQRALTAAVRLLGLALRHEGSAPFGRQVGEQLGALLPADSVVMARAGAGWMTEWSWPEPAAS